MWTQCAGVSEIRLLRGVMWRMVEGQHHISTMKLAASLGDQAELEQILEESKPPLPTDATGRHYLISTPFRYPPLRHGSRFGIVSERGLFYASRELRTTLGETAYYRLLFIQGSEADLDPLVSLHTAFKVNYRARHGIDLTVPPFDAHREPLASASDYGPCQALGALMRADGVTLIRFFSARVPAGINVAALVPEVITSGEPLNAHQWQLVTSEHGVTALQQPATAGMAYEFPRQQFLVNGLLPAPAL